MSENGIFWAVIIGLTGLAVNYFVYKTSAVRMKNKLDSEKKKINKEMMLEQFEFKKKHSEEQKRINIEKQKFNTEMDLIQKRMDTKIRVEQKRLDDEKESIYEEISRIKRDFNEHVKKTTKMFNELQVALDKSFAEKTKGFPWIAEQISVFKYYQNKEEENSLLNKSHPAPVAAEKVKKVNMRARDVERKLRIAQGIIDYYHATFPFLEEFQDIDDETLICVLNKKIDENPLNGIEDMFDSDEERASYLGRLNKTDWDKLSSTEKNQASLDGYINRRKNLWEIGREYERYVGYIYETKKGYKVDFTGINLKFNDLGRDLICTSKKDRNKVHIIQCKNWSVNRQIHENSIMQFYGSVIHYIVDNPEKDVHGVFYTTTTLTEVAKKIAAALGIKIVENFKFDNNYPRIKCNVGAGGTKIYHLPFDQQYDKVVYEPEKGEQYLSTISEAEKHGFRRAFKWMGQKD